ncbi:MAG: O-methyltransferase [Phycisphaerae bacterium]|jgi:predicted O-methyltransferase YrrM
MSKTNWTQRAVLAAVGVVSAAIGIGANQTPRPAPAADEARIMAVIEKLGPDIRRMLSVPPEDGRLLRLLTEAAGAKSVLEIGTSNGYSGLWFCLALKHTGGKLTTIDIDAQKVKLANANFKAAGVDDIVTVIEGDAHQVVTGLKGPFDLVFIDAEKEGYVDYLKKTLPLVRPGGLILAHNTTNSGRNVSDYVKAVTTDPALETVFWNTSDRGMGVTLKKLAGK